MTTEPVTTYTIASAAVEAATEIMRDLSDRGGIDLYQYDEDIVIDIKASVAKSIAKPLCEVSIGADFHEFVSDLIDDAAEESMNGEE